MRKGEGKHPHGMPRHVHRILIAAVAVVGQLAVGVAPRRERVEGGEIVVAREAGVDLHQRGVKHRVVWLVDFIHPRIIPLLLTLPIT